LLCNLAVRSSCFVFMSNHDAAFDVERLKELLEREIVPYVEKHGGSLELVEVTGSTVRVRLRGACEHCSAQMVTLRIGIERLLRRALDPSLRVEHVR